MTTAPDPDTETASARANHKRSYSIPCASAFRDRVLALAEARGMNAADLARSVILVLPRAMIDQAPDPGGPAADDREEITLKSGPGKGKPWRRKPRLQVRLPGGYSPVHLRKALGLALQLDQGALRIALESTRLPTREAESARKQEEIDRLRIAVDTLAADTLTHPVRTKDEALFVLGFPPNSRPTGAEIKARFRQLATIHHPDSTTGSTTRMAQLNQAMSFMRAYD